MQQTVRLSRSPHPYRLRKEQSTNRRSRTKTSHLPTPALTPLQSDTERDRDLSFSRSGSLSDSGTEADDEGLGLVRALPAPPITPSKGLKAGETIPIEYGPSPIPSPSLPSITGKGMGPEYFGKVSQSIVKGKPKVELEGRSRTRRRAEIVRRASEVLSLLGVGLLSFNFYGPEELGLEEETGTLTVRL